MESDASGPYDLPWHRNLLVRLGIFVLLLLAVALSAAGWWLNRMEQGRYQAQNVRHASQVADMVARTLSDRMLAGGGAAVWADVARASEELRGAVGAARISVMGRSGQVKASTDPALAGHQYRKQEDPECAECHARAARPWPVSVTLEPPAGPSLLRVVSPIAKLPACAKCHQEPEQFRGMIAIDFDLSGVEAAAAERRRLFGLIGAALAGAVFLLLYVLLRRFVHQPVSALLGAARQIGDGNLSARADIVREDELGLLGSGFNRMAGRIQQQVSELGLANSELNLLYSLVVEVSRQLEVTRVQEAVIRILWERVNWSRLAFAVDTPERAWLTLAMSADGSEERFGGAGDLASCLLGESAAPARVLPGVPEVVAADACGEQRLSQAMLDGEWHFAMPFIHRGKLIGVLAGSYPPAAEHASIDEQLLKNLAVHVGLALENALNFTQAITDSLTGYHNRRFGMARIEEAMYAAKRYRHPLSLVMFDIDHFKRVNDSHGHPAGDRVLRAVAERVRGAARKSDVFVRYGGEEFMVLLPYTDAEAAAALAERFRAMVEQLRVETPARAIAVTISLGVAQYLPDADETPESLVERADQALYAAKQGGRNRVVVAKGA